MPATLPSAAAIAALTQVLESSRTFMSVCLGVLVWEWLMTLRLEIQYVWRQAFGSTSVLFLLTRYGALAELSVITYIMYWVSHLPTA